MKGKRFTWKKISFGIFVFLFSLLIGEFVLLGIESQTPSFKNPIKDISELIPGDSFNVLLLTNLESETSKILNHQIANRFKQLQITREAMTSNESRPFIEGIGVFEKYTGLTVDLDLFFRFFGEEGAIVRLNKDFLAINKVSQMTLFLKQVAKTLSNYKLLQKDIVSDSYNGIIIDELSMDSRKLYFTFISNYAFSSNSKKRIENIIDLAIGKEYSSISSKNPQFVKAIFQNNEKKYPIVFFEKGNASQGDIEKKKGQDRFKEFFQDHYWKVSIKNKEVDLDYQYDYSDRGKASSLSSIVKPTNAKLAIVNGFPKTTTFTLVSKQFDSEKFYEWLLKSWLVSDLERKKFDKTFQETEKTFKVEIRQFIREGFKSEVSLLVDGIGYQGFNPFPKLAFIAKVNKQANPVDKMKRIFKYAYGIKALNEGKSNDIPIYFYQSDSRFGYQYNSNNSDTSNRMDFSPSFAYFNDYLIVTFNKDTLSNILQTIQNSDGLSRGKLYQEISKKTDKDYSFVYYAQANRLKEFFSSYLNNLYKNEPSDFPNQDAQKRLVPLVELLDEVQGIGGGFNFLNDRIQGAMTIYLR